MSLFPKELSHVVERLTRPVFKERGSAATRLALAWPQIVGTELAQRCSPEKITYAQGSKTDGTLTLSVQNGFALEIQHMQPVILERVASYFGYRAVARLAFVPAKPKPLEASPRRHAPLVAPLPKGAEKLATDVEDPELKAALASLAKTLSGSHT